MVLPFVIIGIGALVTGITGTWLAMRTGTPGSSRNMETSGQINNIVVTDVHDKTQADNGRIYVVLCIICGIKILEFCYFVYRKHIGGILKRKERQQNVAI